MATNLEDFLTRYSNYCLHERICPLKSVVRSIQRKEFCCIVESVTPAHWLYLLSALYKDCSLTKVHFASHISPHENQADLSNTTKNRNKDFPTPYGRTEQNITNMCMSLTGMLHATKYLVVLKLENLPLKVLDAEHLSNGLSESQSLRVLSLAGCKFESGAVAVTCKALQLSRVAWIDFSSCALNSFDVEAVCKVIKAHALRRSNEMFTETLRYRFAILDAMEGISRISLNCNFLERSSLNHLIASLADDLWIKALDLQKCGIENEEAEQLLTIIRTNAQLELVDLRLNNIDTSLLQRIAKQIVLNRSGKKVTHLPMALWKPSELVTKYAERDVRKGKVPKRSPLKVKLIKKVPKRLHHSFAPPSLHKKLRSDGRASRKVTMKDASIQTDDSACFKVFTEEEFNNLRKKIFHETRLRKFLAEKYDAMKAENYQLNEMLNERQKDDIYIDHETYLEVKHTFEKLKIFFEIMKRYGLWEYIAALGFNEITTVSLAEEDSQKSIKVTKKMMTPPSNYPYCNEEHCKQDSERGPCCSCHNDTQHNNEELSNNEHQCSNANKPPSAGIGVKGDHKHNEKVQIQKIFQDIFNLSSGENQSPPSQQQAKPVPVQQTNATNPPQDHVKTANKQIDSLAVAEAVFLKKFSYSNMPKSLRDMITPADFYKIVKKEFERCNGGTKSSPIPSESLIEMISKAQATVNAESSDAVADAVTSHSEKSSTPSVKTEKKGTSAPASNTKFKPNKFERVPRIENVRCTQNSVQEDISEEDFDDISIAELIARRKAMLAKQKQTIPKYIPTKKEPAKPSNPSESKDKPIKNSKSSESNSQGKEQNKSPSSVSNNAPQQASLKSAKKRSDSNASDASSKKVFIMSNASSDEINSSDSVATSSDKLSESSLSRSSSNKSLAKNDDQNENGSQKSYIESVSDESTFKDVESISDIEVVSHVSSKSENGGKKSVAEYRKSVSSATMTDEEPVISNSKVDIPKSTTCDKPVQTGVPKQGKGKKGNKHSNKNRPRSNSNNSSVPSLSDITTVSSKSLNTESVMKQLSGSGKDAKN